jgi:hypothetical protein
MTAAAGIACWGANRDAFFGTPGSCPDELRGAWPTLAKPLPAPRAACATMPTLVPGVTGAKTSFTVGPRGLCYPESDGWRCTGAIPSPHEASGEWVVPSPGQDASACTLRDGRVVCWGEAYSPPGALDRPVTITFDPRSPVRALAVIDGPTARWDKTCRVHSGCDVAPAPLPSCSADVHPRDWSAISMEEARSLNGQVVASARPPGRGGDPSQR